MNYFFILNLVLLLASIERLITLVIKGSQDTKIIAPAPPVEGDALPKPKNRFYTDYFYTTGIIYAALCGLFFLLNCLEIWSDKQIFSAPESQTIGQFLSDRQNYYYFLAATGLTIVFLILPDRTRKLYDAQPYYVALSLAWLFVALISVSLSK